MDINYNYCFAANIRLFFEYAMLLPKNPTGEAMGLFFGPLDANAYSEHDKHQQLLLHFLQSYKRNTIYRYLPYKSLATYL